MLTVATKKSSSRTNEAEEIIHAFIPTLAVVAKSSRLCLVNVSTAECNIIIIVPNDFR